MKDVDNKRLGSKPKPFEMFLKEAVSIHGDKFDYSDFVYVNNKTKGKIHCNVCGYTFEMIPSNHICKKQGCPKCENRLKYTTEECIEKCKEAHGNKYDYSKVNYVNGDTKISIICHEKDKDGIEHGIFLQLPRKHWNGQGCPKCANTLAVKFEEFVERSNKKHNWKYEYYQDTYTSFREKTKIKCPKHGDFWQNAQVHSNGQGCPECYNENKGKNRRITFSEFKKRAEKVHGNKYKYDENSYVNYTTKVKIFCNEHGWFEQMPQKHVERGQGCPKCSLEKHSKRQLLSFEEVIKRFKKTHGEKYAYDKSEYNGQYHKMKIICPTHGEFYQAPYKHWIGQGCPKCNQSHLEREVENLLKELNLDYVYQATKKDLKFLEMKSLDFYIPSFNIAIECQGIQHFEDNGFLKCKNVKIRDADKFNLCSYNNINVIYYTNLEEKINENKFYDDKHKFVNLNNLRKFLINYETTSKEEGV